MSETPKITQMDNDSNYYALLCKSGDSNSQDGTLNKGGWYSATQEEE